MSGIIMTAIKTKETRPPELLAPAGDFTAFKAAVENGADAVYLGGQSFSARANAANFDLPELKQAIRYAHDREVKVYVAVNVLTADQEFPELAEYLYALQEIEADAVILQDVGAADFLRIVLPEVETHASTQMTIQTSWGTRHLEQLGFCRVILARETSAQEMEIIANQTALDLEVFVHGALCVSYSGQCLMSSFIGGRSGNRGRCAQPCRLPYQLVNEKKEDILEQKRLGGHLLSPRDLNLAEELAELQQIGVRALKVEGRMKRPEYVATVIRIYRQALDRLENQREAGPLLKAEERQELLQIFNRDFTSGYFRENLGAELMSYSRPNNRGTRLGRVTGLEAGWLSLKLEAALHPGDGIEVWTSRGREGVTVGKIWRKRLEIEEGLPGESVEIAFPGLAQSGDRVFKTNDAFLMEKACLSYQEGREQRRRPLDMRLAGRSGEKLRLEVREGERKVTVYSANVLQKALTKPLTEDFAAQQLGRLGTTPFRLVKLELKIDEPVMLPVSDLNEMRRLAVAELLQSAARPKVERDKFEQRVKQWRKRQAEERAGLIRETGSVRPLVSVAVSNVETLQAALQAGAKRVLIGGEHWRTRRGFSFREIRESLESCQKLGVDCVWRLPCILNQAQSAALYADLQKAADWLEKPKLMLANLGELEIMRAVDPNWPFEIDNTLNVFNEAALAYFLRLGAKGVTLSPELHGGQLALLAKWPRTELLVFGDMEMMVSEYCLVGSTLGGKKGQRCAGSCGKGPYFLRDRMGYDFPLETDQECRMHLFNVKVLNLYAELPQIRRWGFSAVRLQMTRQTPEQVRQVVSLFRVAWEEQENQEKQREDNVDKMDKIDKINDGPAEKEMRKLASLFPAGFTKGHFFRGVL